MIVVYLDPRDDKTKNACLKTKVIQHAHVLLNNEFVTFCPKYFQNYPLFYRNKLCLKLTDIRYSHT